LAIYFNKKLSKLSFFNKKLFRLIKMKAVGYQYLCNQLRLSAIPPRLPARIAPVLRVTRTHDALLVPGNVAPSSNSVIDHILFALKHEGVNLQILAQALHVVSDTALLEQVQSSPSSRYVRILGFLWESLLGRALVGEFTIAGPTVDVFDPKRYVTGPAQRNARWRVNFNGLGTIQYCATVQRTDHIVRMLDRDILGRADQFLAELGQHATDRALAWAYLHETESSFAIERELPMQDKASAFVSLLKQAHAPRRMDEPYLVELQNAVITNPFDLSASYRHEQNWLRGPLRGAAGITYIPPPPELVRELMQGALSFVNELPRVIDPLVAAAIGSFAFVFIHPFMDGNGRLSRFLFHYALCQSGRLTNGALLPVSAAMKRNEEAYLQALQSYSAPIRSRWDVRWIGDETYDLKFLGDESLYRYWDATRVVEFALDMADQALDQDLREQTKYLDRFDRAYKLVNERFDVRGNDLTTLLISALQNNGVVSNNRRKQFQYRVPEMVFDAIEQACAQVVKQDEGDRG
jgi:Fic family protein